MNWSLILSFALAFVSVFTASLTTWLNNKHIYKMRKLDLTHELIKNDKLHKRELFESLLLSLGKFGVMYEDEKTFIKNEDLVEISERYLLVLPYLPKDIIDQFKIVFESVVNKEESTEFKQGRDALFNHVIPFIREETKLP